MTPHQIATQAAEAIFMPRSRSLHPDPDTAHELHIEECAALILSAAKMVRESGAIEALDSAQLGCRLDQRILLQNREKLAEACDKALHSLRSITGEAGE